MRLPAFILLLAVWAPGSADVSRTSGDDGAYSFTAVTDTFSHSVTAGTDTLVVVVSYYNGASTDNITATYNGTSLTRPAGSACESGSSMQGGAVLYLNNPDSGANNLVIDSNVAFCCDTGANVFAYSYDGVDTTGATIVDSDCVGNGGAGQALGLTFTGGGSGDMMVGLCGAFAVSPNSTGNSQTPIANQIFNNDASDTFQKAWDAGDGNDIACTGVDYGWITGIVLNAAGAAGPDIRLLRRGRGR